MGQAIKINWKTTALGIFGLLAAVGALGNAALSGDFSTVHAQLPAILASIGLLFAKDSTGS